ncbi:hypothetical protein BABINDRAFT_163147 [Babjeviella inositovora NRRL Y-12698]|uniref:Uncharacterized protein n=1 Tax=Babjeviella inositovora NRRL Y-12698 TaxID=984486 RepID=A0A1E3QJ68_9ASCO|nr:uncharacterized protein BABINDRAFT_163147 [Babjeviella inositovora NRRL Y-12698]ODQ77745.1 hypothetical protein BABINDRAFT_163147 [Babjeviella inositovora NRRL Y-12698]
MFGAVCSGRPMQTANQVGPNKYVLTIPNGSNLNHVAIFLLPNNEIPYDYSCLVYFQLPTSPEDFKLLGAISAVKPSAIFKFNSTTASQNTAYLDDESMMDDVPASGDIVIGISIETTAQAEMLLQQAKQVPPQSNALVRHSQPQLSDTAVLANRIVAHAYNFLGGFIDEQGKVPISRFDDWWSKFKAKLQNNPRFLDNVE